MVIAISLTLARRSEDTVPRPPELTAPSTITVSNDNSRLFLADGKDYVLKLPSSPLTAKGGLWVVGGRNVVIVGGEIAANEPIDSSSEISDAYGLYLKNQTGTVHVEGLWIHGRGIGQAIVLDEGEGATVQVVRCRLEPLQPVGRVHTDAIQTFRGPFRLRLSNVTIKTAGVGLQTMPHQFGPIRLGSWEYRRVDIEQTTPDAYALWKAPHAGGYWREVHEDFWVANLGYLASPDEQHWNPGGPARVTGHEMRIGRPPNGDFVPAASVGIGYGS